LAFNCVAAFGYHSEKTSTSFKDLGFNPTYNGTDISWGWSNGPLATSNFAYTFDLYAAGSKVGTMIVVYDGEEASVTIDMGERLWLKDIHAYVGNDVLPKDESGYAIADPTKFPIIHERMSLFRSFTVDNFDGKPVHVVVHASVCGIHAEDAKPAEEVAPKGVAGYLRKLW
jgi:hypothetical protein